MNCVPDFASWLWLVGLLGGAAGILYGTCVIDKELGCCNKARIWRCWLVNCIVVEIGFWKLVIESQYFVKVCFLILAVYLVVCSVMDSMLCKVNDFMQYIGIIGVSILVLYLKPDRQIGVSLILFGLVQAFVFRKMYGGADVMAFLICAGYLAAMNRDMESYLYHMIGCYLLLAIVQGVKRNINRKGNLKKPVPLLPYISVSFLMIIC